MRGPKIRGDLRRYWWVGIVGFMLVGGWLAVPLLEKSSYDVAVDEIGPSDMDAVDLDSLEGLNPEEQAPGGPFGYGGAEGRRDNISMLGGKAGGWGYVGPKSSVSGSKAKPSAAGKKPPTASSYGKYSRYPKSKYDYASRRSGSRKGLKGKLGLGSRGSGGGSRAGGPLLGMGGREPFGKGSAKDLSIVKGNFSGYGSGRLGDISKKAVNKLDKADEAGRDSLVGGNERVKYQSGTAFEGKGSGEGNVSPGDGGSDAISQLKGAADTPADLKKANPQLPPGKKITPPSPKEEEAEKESMEEKITMMLMQQMMSSMLGPVFGGMASTLMGGMGMNENEIKMAKLEEENLQLKRKLDIKDE